MTGGIDGHGSGTGPVVILLHGFGAPGDDLVPLGDVIAAPAGTRFFFPAAPLSLQMGMNEARAWWMLDMARRQREIAAGHARDLTKEIPAGLAEARERVMALLNDLNRRYGAVPARTIIGGFSQGAMLACDTVLRMDQSLAGLVLLSGTLLAQEEWKPLMVKRRGLPVLQSHGNADPILPVVLAEQLRDLLIQAGLAVQWVGFRGAHEIPQIVLHSLDVFLRQVLTR
jgi:phospholipase/carboxylesterase